MITLHKFNAAWGLPDISPFCIKVETYLRMAGIPFDTVVADGRKAPKKKLPYVDDGGTIVCDSRDIIEHFEAKSQSPLDAGLTSSERATAVAFRALFEEELYFHAVYLRWQLDDGFRVYAPVLREYGSHIGVPGFLTPLIVRSVRKQILRDAWGQGTGRHTKEEVEKRLCMALEAISVQLGERDYFLGDRPRTIDATAHAFLWAFLDAPFESPAREYAESLKNLGTYCERMKKRYFATPAGEAELAQKSLRLVGTAA